mgnify:CR=1 FL=1
MSITVSQKISSLTYYPGFGASTDSSVDVTYTVARIVLFDGTMVTAEYDVSVGSDKAVIPYRFTFKYSGSGNPLDQAEPALQSYLS